MGLSIGGILDNKDSKEWDTRGTFLITGHFFDSSIWTEIRGWGDGRSY
jgi:hypothetical protein